MQGVGGGSASMYWNPYGYVGGNPVNFTDPSGLCPMCFIALVAGVKALATTAVAVGVGVGVTALAIDAGTQYLDDGHINWGGAFRRAGEWGLGAGIGYFTGGLLAPGLAAGTMTLGRAALISGAVDATWSLGYELAVHRNDFGTALFNTAFGSILGEVGALAKPIARGLSGTWLGRTGTRLGRGARWAGRRVGQSLNHPRVTRALLLPISPMFGASDLRPQRLPGFEPSEEMFVVRTYREWNNMLDRDRKRPPRALEGWEGHHGIPKVWLYANIDNYDELDDVVIAMTSNLHNRTRSVYNRWITRMSQTRGWGSNVPWDQVSEQDIMRLVSEMNNQAEIPNDIWDEYLRLHNQYIDSLR